jgi:RecA-family ATPase
MEEAMELLSEDQVLAQHGACSLVPGFLPAAGLTLAWGPPKDGGKSAFWLRQARRIAQGLPVFGRSDGPGLETIYIATEGTGSLRDRMEGLRMAEGAAPLFRVMTDPLDLFAPDDVDWLIGAAEDAHLIVIDTLARLFSRAGRDENSADMGRLLATLDTIRLDTGAAIVLVHHGAKDGIAPRGHSSLVGAVDTVIQHAMLGDGSRTATLTHARDGGAGALWRYKLRQFHLPAGDYAPARTTIVAEEMDEAAASATASAASAAGPPAPKRRR